MVSLNGIARTLSDAAQDTHVPVALDAAFRPLYADRLTRTADMVKGVGTSRQPEPDAPEVSETSEMPRQLEDEIGHRRHASPTFWAAEGDLAIEMEQILRELTHSNAPVAPLDSSGAGHRRSDVGRGT